MSHRQHGSRRRTLGSILPLLLVAGATLTLAGRAPSTTAGSARAEYVVHGSTLRVVRDDVTAVGGDVVVAIPDLRDVIARLSSGAAHTLSSDRGVLVALDGSVHVADTAPSPSDSPDSVFDQVTGASRLYPGGDEGAGVTVAVLDTGIDAQLSDFGGRVIDGIDLTGAHNPFDDGYGHGTFVAGLIGSSGVSSGGQYVGEAPEVNLVSIKVAGANGLTSVGTITEGIAWAISHRVVDNIRVLNLSLGAVPKGPSALEPLDEAVEQAWRAGIVVVTTAGNSGPGNGTITSPGDDPLVITVGALDDQGTTNPADYSIPAFSSVGPTRFDGWLKPDVVAPGSSVVSLAAPGSTVDVEYPSARIGTTNFLGSGTSFSAAIVSGEIALMFAAQPALTPDQVKSRLLFTTDAGPAGNPFVDGHGLTDVFAAVTAQSVPTINQSSASLAELLSPALSLFAPLIKLSRPWSASTWNPSNWSGVPATGDAWNVGVLPVITPAVTGAAWNGAAWNGAAWNGAAWNGAAWNGAAWNGAAWNGAAWNGAAWNGFVTGARPTGTEH